MGEAEKPEDGRDNPGNLGRPIQPPKATRGPNRQNTDEKDKHHLHADDDHLNNLAFAAAQNGDGPANQYYNGEENLKSTTEIKVSSD